MTSLCLFGSLGEFAVKLKATIDKISSFFALVKGPKVFRRKNRYHFKFLPKLEHIKCSPHTPGQVRSCKVTVTFPVASKMKNNLKHNHVWTLVILQAHLATKELKHCQAIFACFGFKCLLVIQPPAPLIGSYGPTH